LPSATLSEAAQQLDCIGEGLLEVVQCFQERQAGIWRRRWRRLIRMLLDAIGEQTLLGCDLIIDALDLRNNSGFFSRLGGLQLRLQRGYFALQSGYFGGIRFAFGCVVWHRTLLKIDSKDRFEKIARADDTPNDSVISSSTFAADSQNVAFVRGATKSLIGFLCWRFRTRLISEEGIDEDSGCEQVVSC
jgi:hypothetical protein